MRLLSCAVVASSLLLTSSPGVVAASTYVPPSSLSDIIRVASSRIKHVVVLMMENRSFDHLLGWLHEDWTNEIDGLSTGTTTPRDPKDLSKGYVEITRDGYDEGPDDPMHDYDSIHEQIDSNAMDGFVWNALNVHHNESNPVAMFDSVSAPVLNNLAREFAVFDKWFCSVPGPTDPNRGYAMAGSSVGVLHNFDGKLWQQQSYFDLLRSNNRTFNAYYQQDLWAIAYFQDMKKPENSRFMKDLDTHFYTDVAAGNVADFTWLQPRLTPHNNLPTWQHPDASIKVGEELISSIYSALRASPVWESTLFIITYDEHGGFYDHVPPPQGAPNPDGINAPNGFTFDQLGVRIPTLAISPWIAKGTIVHWSLPNEQPTPNSAFESTSILSSTHALLGLRESGVSLLGSARADWANTFLGLLTQLEEPRQDCPMTFGDVNDDTTSSADTDDATVQLQLSVSDAASPSSSSSLHAQLRFQRAKPVNDHLVHQILFYCYQLYGGEQNCEGLSSHVLQNQGAAADWIVAQSHVYVARLREAERKFDEEQLNQQPPVVAAETVTAPAAAASVDDGHKEATIVSSELVETA